MLPRKPDHPGMPDRLCESCLYWPESGGLVRTCAKDMPPVKLSVDETQDEYGRGISWPKTFSDDRCSEFEYR